MYTRLYLWLYNYVSYRNQGLLNLYIHVSKFLFLLPPGRQPFWQKQQKQVFSTEPNEEKRSGGSMH